MHGGWVSSLRGPEWLEDRVRGEVGAEEVAEHGLERWEDHAEFWTSWFWPLRSPC